MPILGLASSIFLPIILFYTSTLSSTLDNTECIEGPIGALGFSSWASPNSFASNEPNLDAIVACQNTCLNAPFCDQH